MKFFNEINDDDMRMLLFNMMKDSVENFGKNGGKLNFRKIANNDEAFTETREHIKESTFYWELFLD